MKQIITSALAICLLSSVGFSQSFKLNDKVSGLSFMDAKSDSTTFLSDYSSKNAVVILFVSDNCPFVNSYISRIQALETTHPQTQFVTVKSNTLDSKSAIKARFNSCLSLCVNDRSGSLAKRMGATKTPEAFILQQRKGSFYLVYKGALDDNPQSASHVDRPYVDTLLTAIEKGESITATENIAFGCSIK